MYYILECYGPDEEDRRSLASIPSIEGINWSLGRQFEKPIPNPFEVVLDAESSGLMMPMFKRKVLLFSDDMLKALASAGVDNLELYPALLTDPTSGKKWTNYKAVNIIGLVACADMDKSEWEAPSGSAIIDVDFDSLAIDESKTRGLLMFRLG